MGMMKNEMNMKTEYKGYVIINGDWMQVVSETSFNGTPHFGIIGETGGKSIIGWIPQALAEIPDEKEVAIYERTKAKYAWTAAAHAFQTLGSLANHKGVNE